MYVIITILIAMATAAAGAYGGYQYRKQASEKKIGRTEEYAKNLGRDSMIRVFPDGKVQVKDFSGGEIVETTAEEFLNFYEDDNSHEHHHEGCDCGHCH